MSKSLLIILFSILFCLPVKGQTEKSDTPFLPLPDWLPEAVIYQIYPASFKDSDGDGIGDLQGILSHLDYIRSLGCNTLWLNPCFHSAFRDGGYDVIDYYQVAPRYGTNETLCKLMSEAHKRDMHVILDLVAGHTSDQSLWFIQSQKGEDSPLSHRYIWTPDSALCPPKFIRGRFERNGCYLKNYFPFQPALNYGYGHPDSAHSWEEPFDAPGPTATRQELMRIMDYWMEQGCDGFRIDMAGSLVKNDPDFSCTRRLWHEIRAHFQSRWPHGVLLAEWGHPEKARDIGFMADFLFQFGLEGYRELFFNEVGVYRRDTCYFDQRGIGSAHTFIHSLTSALQSAAGEACLCLPTGNHDVQRLRCGPRQTNDELKVALTFLFTQPAIPCLYYGDEIGMKYLEPLPDVEGSCISKGNRAGSRTPMQWDASPLAGFSTAQASQLYLPLPPMSERLTVNVAVQERDSTSLLHYVRSLLAIRSQQPVLSIKSSITYLTPTEKQAYPLAYLRTSPQGHQIGVFINPSGREVSATYHFPSFHHLQPLHGCGGTPLLQPYHEELTISMPPISAIIYQIIE